MANNDTQETLKTFVREIADSIRYAENSTGLINPQDFKDRIKDLKPEGELDITENGTYNVATKEKVNVIVTGGDVEKYQGEYEVTPSTAETDQVLATKNKMLLDNVVVKPIPYFEVSGPVSGKIVYIGGTVTTNLDNNNN